MVRTLMRSFGRKYVLDDRSGTVICTRLPSLRRGGMTMEPTFPCGCAVYLRSAVMNKDSSRPYHKDGDFLDIANEEGDRTTFVAGEDIAQPTCWPKE